MTYESGQVEGIWLGITLAAALVHAMKLQHIDRRAGQIARQGQSADLAKVPKKVDALQAHGGYARRRADDQNLATGARAIGHEFP